MEELLKKIKTFCLKDLPKKVKAFRLLPASPKKQAIILALLLLAYWLLESFTFTCFGFTGRGTDHFYLAAIPVLLAATIFGPLQGLSVAFVGELFVQLLRENFNNTTLLLALPALLFAISISLIFLFFKRSTKLVPSILNAVVSSLLFWSTSLLADWININLKGFYYPGLFSSALPASFFGLGLLIVISFLFLFFLVPLLSKED